MQKKQLSPKLLFKIYLQLVQYTSIYLQSHLYLYLFKIIDSNSSI